MSCQNVGLYTAESYFQAYTYMYVQVWMEAQWDAMFLQCNLEYACMCFGSKLI